MEKPKRSTVKKGQQHIIEIWVAVGDSGWQSFENTAEWISMADLYDRLATLCSNTHMALEMISLSTQILDL